jgi:hypothetical protein
MNKKIAQEKTINARTYWDLLKPGTLPQDANEEEKNLIKKLKDTFTKYLSNFRKEFGSKEIADYAVQKLIKRYKNEKINRGYLYSYKVAISGDVEKYFWNIMQEVENEVKSELSIGREDEALDISLEEGGNPWTFIEWKNTLGMMLKRASYQYNNIKIDENKPEDIKKAELKNKREYFVAVKRLLNKLGKIMNGDNPEKRKLAPNETIPDSWLGGYGAGGLGGVGGRKYPGGRSPGGRRYPGGASGAGLDEGFTETQKELLYNPFGSKELGDYLHVHDLLRAYGLDQVPEYSILMETKPSELPGRPWRTRRVSAAMNSLGNDRGLFYKYVPALKNAINEIVNLYTDIAKANNTYNPKQAQLGKQYESSINYMMRKKNIPELTTMEVKPYEESFTDRQTQSGRTSVTLPTESKNPEQDWKVRASDSDFINKVDDFLSTKGFETYYKGNNFLGWRKVNSEGNTIFISSKNGGIYSKLKQDNKWRKAGYMLNEAPFLLGESKPNESGGSSVSGSASFDI